MISTNFVDCIADFEQNVMPYLKENQKKRSKKVMYVCCDVTLIVMWLIFIYILNCQVFFNCLD